MKKHDMTVPAGLKPGDTFPQGHCEMIVMDVAAPEAEKPELCAVEMIRALPTEQVHPSPINRKYFNPADFVELVDSMREVGQTTPGIVRRKADGTYELVAGDRRWQACCELGIPFRAMVRTYTDAQAAEILLTENAKREGLRPVDEAQIYGAMLALRDEAGNHVFTLRKIAQRVHGDETRFAYVAKMHKLLDLPKDVAEALNNGVIPVRVAFLVARIADLKDREEAGKRVIKDKWSGQPLTVKQAAEMIQREYQVSLKGWGDELMESTDLLDAAQRESFGFKGKPGEKEDGSCARCPWLAKNHPAFADSLSGGCGAEVGVDPMTCTRAKCHQAKLNTLWVQKAEKFREEKAAQTTMILPTGEFKPGAASKYVALEASPSGHDTGDWNQEAPKWKKLLKGADVPIVIGDKPDTGEPVLLVERSVALTAAKQAHPDLFVKAKAEVKVKDLNAEERKAHEERERKRKEREAMDKKIAEEVKTDSLRAMLDHIISKGLGLDGRKVLVQAVARNAGEMEPILCLLLGRKVKAQTWKQEEKLLAEAVEGRTANELDAMIALMAVHDDVAMSGTQKAEDFNDLCGAIGVDLKAVAKRVRDAHAMADRAAKKATADKEKAGAKKNEQINAELKVKSILAEGDEQRKKAPSRKQVGPGMFAEGPIMEAAMKGMPTVTGSRSKLGMWELESDVKAAEGAETVGNSAPLIQAVIKDKDCAAGVLDQLKTLSVPQQKKNEHGVFENPSNIQCIVWRSDFKAEVTFSILLACDEKGWFSRAVEYSVGRGTATGTCSGGGLPKGGHMFAIRSSAIAEAARDLVTLFKKDIGPKNLKEDVAKAREFLAELKKLAVTTAAVESAAWDKQNNPQPGDKPKVSKNQRAGETEEEFRRREAERIAAYKAAKKSAKPAAKKAA